MSRITQPTVPCHIPADAEEDILLGVDTHKDVHAAAVITTLGATLDGRSFPATAEGYRQLLLAELGVTGPAGAARHTLRLLARRIQHLTEEINDLNKRITEAIKARTPGLLDVHGVGPDTAAALLISAGDNPERLDSEASFAALCGTSPVEASSGKTQRRRLNRGGDRQANAALYRIILSRLRWAGPSQDYLRRRLAEARPNERSSAASNGTSHERSTGTLSSQTLRHTPRNQPETPLDIHRGINAVSEAFNSVLKVEYVHRHAFRTRSEARIKIATWITDFYNARRLHSVCGFKSPIDYERDYRATLAEGLAA